MHGIERVIILARSEDKYITTWNEWRQSEAISLKQDDPRVKFVKCDLGDIENVKVATEKIKELTDRVHILVCNAGEYLNNTSLHSATIEPDRCT